MKKQINKWLLAAGFLLVLATVQAAQATQWLNAIVAVVNDEVITQAELEQQVEKTLQQLRSQGQQTPPLELFRKQVLEHMVVGRLQLQLANSSGIRIDDTTLDRTLENLAQQNNLTLKQFRDVLAQDGYPFAEFREEMRKDITINRLRQREVDNRLVITEQDIDNFLLTQQAQGSVNDEYRISHILIAVKEGATPEQIDVTRQQAQQVLADLVGGADFSQTAMTRSAGQTALSGGDIGWRKLGQMPTIFADIVVTMDPGDFSDLIRSPSGFHIIKLEEKRSAQQSRNVITQYKVRHILSIPSNPAALEQSRQRLERLRERILNGEDFAELATANSDDRGSAVNGGELGWVNPGQMVPEFEQVMQQTPVGQLSKVFQSRFGWHFLQVQEIRDHDNTEELQRNQAREALHQRRVEEEYELWLRRLRDEAFVEIRL